MPAIALAAVPNSRVSVKRIYAEYYVRRKSSTVYEVAKFVNGSDCPIDYYTLVETSRGIKCDCQGWIIHPYECKHGWIVPEFKRLERESRFDIDILYPCTFTEWL